MAETPEKQTRTPKPKAPTKLFKKLVQIREGVEYLQKRKHEGAAQYAYTSSSQVLASVREKMNELGILLMPSIVAANVRENLTKSGTQVYFTELMMNMVWIDSESGETYEVPWYGQGVDLAGEKGPGKALTYAEKYVILKTFNIPTDKDDPDAFQDKNAPAIDVKATMLEKLEKADSIQTVADVWVQNPKLQSDDDFKKACAAAKKRLTPEPTDG